jgi:hydroxymethylpyrimidine/phosphomethylpyrimidine kinase
MQQDTNRTEQTPQSSSHIPRALTIAGSDSGGGAGIQADLKTFAAMGVYGMSAITSVTVQNTEGVRDAFDIPLAIISGQIDAVIEDIGVDAAKTGMLASSEIIEAVADRVQAWKLRLVVDPVMVAKGGAQLLKREAVVTLRQKLLPLAEVVTPNLLEAEVLLEQRIRTLEDMREAARMIAALGPRHVIVKGGHLQTDPIDVHFDGHTFHELRAERVGTQHTHGTGCTFSAAITALLARGWSVNDAVVRAKRYVTGAIRHAPGLGHGHGPIDHFWIWEDAQNAQALSS